MTIRANLPAWVEIAKANIRWQYMYRFNVAVGIGMTGLTIYLLTVVWRAAYGDQETVDGIAREAGAGSRERRCSAVHEVDLGLRRGSQRKNAAAPQRHYGDRRPVAAEAHRERQREFDVGGRAERFEAAGIEPGVAALLEPPVDRYASCSRHNLPFLLLRPTGVRTGSIA